MSNRGKRFILQGTEPREEPDTFKWARWFESADRQIELTDISTFVSVSTVFVGLGHTLFETLIRGGVYAGQTFRAQTWQEAARCHALAVTQCRDAEADVSLTGWTSEKVADA